MALTQALIEARRETATRANRERQARAELRLEELIKVEGIADDYETVDRRGDNRIETAFARIYQAADSDHLRSLVTKAYIAWQDDEREEERIVRNGVGSSLAFLKVNNPVWLDGAAVPSGSDGAA